MNLFNSPSPNAPIRSGILIAFAFAGLSACGGGSATAETASSLPAVTDTAVAIQASTTAPEAAPEPATTSAPAATDAPATTDAPAAIELTPELAAFADSNSALMEDWSAQLVAFGSEAMDHLGNVSEAPSSPALLELSDQVVAAIGPDATDPGLVVAHDFASGVSMAITQSIDGDQSSAMTGFIELQEHADQLTATLDQFGA